jgi:hypothetical protein
MGKKLGVFTLFFMSFFTNVSENFLANFPENSGVVGVHIGLLASLLMLELLLVGLYYI